MWRVQVVEYAWNPDVAMDNSRCGNPAATEYALAGVDDDKHLFARERREALMERTKGHMLKRESAPVIGFVEEGANGFMSFDKNAPKFRVNAPIFSYGDLIASKHDCSTRFFHGKPLIV